MTISNLEDLFNKRADRIKPGLQRMESALKYLPELTLSPCIIIAGTNGKGSTSAYLWRILSTLGLKVGLYTSPHLVNFSERIQVSGERIDDQFLLFQLGQLQKSMPETVFEELSFFEATTLLARRVFLQAHTDIDILEVGLGGRWDSTNAFSPMATSVVSIGLDHIQYLGDTVEAIAREKLGIARKGVPMVWGTVPRDRDSNATTQLAKETAQKLAFPLMRAEVDFSVFSDDTFHIARHVVPELGEIKGQIPEWLMGKPRFLKDNFAVAAALAAYVSYSIDKTVSSPRLVSSISDDGVSASSYPWPPSMRARFQERICEHEGRTLNLLLDVCHNPAGARAFVDGLKEKFPEIEHGARVPGLISMLGDKDIAATLAILLEVISPIIFYKASSERAWAHRDIAKVLGSQDFVLQEDFRSAWHHALKSWEVSNLPWVICGSVYGLGEAFAVLDDCRA